jgi:hypothetical protein
MTAATPLDHEGKMLLNYSPVEAIGRSALIKLLVARLCDPEAPR